MDQNKNITEYIIEIYRKEDLMRAYKFDLEKFGTQVINFFPITPKEKLAEVNHYEAFMKKMTEQGIQESGHLAEVNEIVAQLDQLHEELKSSDENYNHIYLKAKPYINENMQVAKGTITSEVQLCLNGIYGFLLLKIEERPIKPEEQTMIDQFGNLLSLLSYKYNERKVMN
ncbi:DUF4924 family protein [Reichenbachiella agariperforans]|uniref:DUF4924 family protein n=1 Tax=Reichenbachiella agariperforans TaxID=156994 RepID=UPI001C09B5E8|nr:DUF4924 family protein [Reichenbachiella agariperforans]MBU2912831.1 DUF4924 family protein [Reichenbachiella agariperforans]